MNRDDVLRLLKAAKGLDSFIKGDDNQINAWHATLDSGMSYEFARKVLVQHYRASAVTVRPSNFTLAWRAEVDLQNWRDQSKSQENLSHIPATPETVRKFVEMAKSAMAGNPTSSKGA